MAFWRITVNETKASKDFDSAKVRLFACKELVQCSTFIRFSEAIIYELNYGIYSLSSKERRYVPTNKDGMDLI